MPWTSVCLVAEMVWTWMVGSSSVNDCSAWPILALSALVAGETATEKSGRGKIGGSSTMPLPALVKVSPVLHVVQLGNHADVTGDQFIDGVQFLAAYVKEVGDTIALTRARVEQLRISLDRAGEDADVVHAAHKAVDDGLEDDCRHRAIGIASQFDPLAILGGAERSLRRRGT